MTGLPRDIFDAIESLGNEPETPSSTRASTMFKPISTFVDEYTPLSYAVEPIIRGASLYTLTARTGAGKTAFNVVATLAVATGRPDILGMDVTRGRVAYLAAENPDDIRMRFKIAAFLLEVDLAEIGEQIVVLDQRKRPEDACADLSRLAQSEPFALVLVDTLAAFFDGKNINDAVEGGEFLRRLRPFTRIAGAPAVLVSAHPVKNAVEEALVPYGSGAILNEVDGNLTLWKHAESGVVQLYWQGKLRGLEFQPRHFRFEIAGAPTILDAKGREVQLPTLRPTTTQAADEKRKDDAEISRDLLRAMSANPNATLEGWGLAIGRAKGSVSKRLQALAAEDLVEKTLDRWALTAKGRREAKVTQPF
jgi:hypothetical protein